MACSFPDEMKANNATLNRYFTDYVQVEKEKTTRIREEVLSNLDAILDYVNSRDKHYGKVGVRVGSSTQGLNVKVKGDIDCSVVFKLYPDESDDHPSNILFWENHSHQRLYGFEYPTQNDTSSLSDELKIVATQYPLPSPQTGYCFIGGFSVYKPCHSDLSEFVFKEDLIPFLVKRKFKCLLLEASKNLQLRDEMKLSKIIHGPALSFNAEVTMSDGKTHTVTIDLAVVIRGKTLFVPAMGWPVNGKLWPSQDKIDSILKMGINDVAKKPFYWQMSFAELEKELVLEIDKDGGCRKKVHRIMKSVYYTVCKGDTYLSSYMLKNVWFLELEKYPNPGWWVQVYLSDRYYGCLDSLLMYVNVCKLPQYFDRRINLLKMDRISDIRKDVDKIRSFRFDTADQRKRPQSDLLAPQSFKKTKVADSKISTPQ